MRRRIGFAILTATIVIAAAMPAGASAEPSDPPRCIGDFVSTAAVTGGAETGGIGPFMSGWAEANGPGSIAELGQAFKAAC
jgi:hypothetical protein